MAPYCFSIGTKSPSEAKSVSTKCVGLSVHPRGNSSGLILMGSEAYEAGSVLLLRMSVNRTSSHAAQLVDPSKSG